jgi:hypothetical protein
MDERLEKALDYSNFRMILTTRQKNLKTLMENRLSLSYQGGLFKINKELISLLFVLMASELNEFIFIDSNDIPVLVTDVQDFAKTTMEKYRDALAQYYRDYQKLDQAREIRKVVDWDEE